MADENISHESEWKDWVKKIKNYSYPDNAKSWWQILNSFIPYFGLWILMVYSLEISYWLTLGLSVLAAGFLVRIFIIFHDCGHGSFFKSDLLSRVVGIIGGLLVFTPYHKWHYSHMVHHRTVGNLDKRGIGDVKTLTVEEFMNLSSWGKFQYRMYRNPVVLFLIAPFFLFTIAFRIPGKESSKKIHFYTHLTTIALVAGILIMSYFIGFKAFIMIQIPILYFASSIGVWLFYVQHQFEDAIWERSDNWDFRTIAFETSSWLKFPKILQWFSGNIGFHHIHHLSPKVPNYKLEKCLKENPVFQKKPITFIPSIKSVKYRLWDEKNYRMVSFREAFRLVGQ